MSYLITCPYCFAQLKDSDVMFRSERVSSNEPDMLPPDAEDIEEYRRRRRLGKDEEDDVTIAYKEWEFFSRGISERYDGFWRQFNGTTEYNPADDILRIKAYERRVIDPYDPAHARYLRMQQNGSPFIYDRDGMISSVELVSGEKCYRRVCPCCHNPFPDNYGKFPIHFVSIIGITGAGKTVYLSQLLKGMKKYSEKVGYSAIVNNTGVTAFIEKNRVAAGVPLPGSTPTNRLQQPLIFQLVRDCGNNQKATETFVLYDVAGEVFKDEELIKRFAPFIQHVDGAIVLIDPLQFEVISEASGSAEALDEPTTALEAIHNIITAAQSNLKCSIPFAICISKADMGEVQGVLGEELKSRLLNDVTSVLDRDGYSAQIFNAREYEPIGRALLHFVQKNANVLSGQMHKNYTNFNYFAFTALGCPVKNGAPVGPVLPKRIEEPLLWMFYKLGYVGRNGHVPGETYCPECDSNRVNLIPEEERIVTVKEKGLFGKKLQMYVDHVCRDCGYQWNNDPEAYM